MAEIEIDYKILKERLVFEDLSREEQEFILERAKKQRIEEIVKKICESFDNNSYYFVFSDIFDLLSVKEDFEIAEEMINTDFKLIVKVVVLELLGRSDSINADNLRKVQKVLNSVLQVSIASPEYWGKIIKNLQERIPSPDTARDLLRFIENLQDEEKLEEYKKALKEAVLQNEKQRGSSIGTTKIKKELGLNPEYKKLLNQADLEVFENEGVYSRTLAKYEFLLEQGIDIGKHRKTILMLSKKQPRGYEKLMKEAAVEAGILLPIPKEKFRWRFWR